MGENQIISTIVRIWFTRLPAFLVGMLVAKYTLERKLGISRRYCFVIVALSVLCLAVTLINYYKEIPSFWLINRLLFLPIVLGIVIVYILMSEMGKGVTIQTGLKWFGAITLEIYLLHEKVLSTTDGLVKRIGINESIGSIISNVVAIVVAVFLAKVLHDFIEKCILKKKHM